MTRMTASSLLRGLFTIFELPATAIPAEAEGVQEVGLNVTALISQDQLEQLRILSELTRTQVVVQEKGASRQVTFTAQGKPTSALMPVPHGN